MDTGYDEDNNENYKEYREKETEVIKYEPPDGSTPLCTTISLIPCQGGMPAGNPCDPKDKWESIQNRSTEDAATPCRSRQEQTQGQVKAPLEYI